MFICVGDMSYPSAFHNHSMWSMTSWISQTADFDLEPGWPWMALTLTLTNFVHQGVIWNIYAEISSKWQFDCWPWVTLNAFDLDQFCAQGRLLKNICWKWSKSEFYIWLWVTLDDFDVTFDGVDHSYKPNGFALSQYDQYSLTIWPTMSIWPWSWVTLDDIALGPSMIECLGRPWITLTLCDLRWPWRWTFGGAVHSYKPNGLVRPWLWPLMVQCVDTNLMTFVWSQCD